LHSLSNRAIVHVYSNRRIYLSAPVVRALAGDERDGSRPGEIKTELSNPTSPFSKTIAQFFYFKSEALSLRTSGSRSC